MNIYIDFDRTLFDTDKFFKDLDDIIESSGITVDDFLKYVKKTENNGFNPYTVLKLMENDYEFSKNIYSEIDNLIKKANLYVYSDVYSFLKKIRERGYKVFILTKGNEKYQLSKIRNTDLFKYFDGVLVTLKLKGELDLNYKDSVFIDDNPKELESIFIKKPKKVIRIKRDNAKYSNIDVNKEILEVKSLKEIVL